MDFLHSQEHNDDCVFCEQCNDSVYEYCSLHGALLVIPDSKVPTKLNLQAYVPRAAMTIPDLFLHLDRSNIPGAGLGVFATRTLPRGVRFGPYSGDILKETSSFYSWQIYDVNNRRSHCVDARDINKSNWMRYVNCARHFCDQNLLAFQYQGQLFYRTIKVIPRFTELLVFYGYEHAKILKINLKNYNSPSAFKLNDSPTEKECFKTNVSIGNIIEDTAKDRNNLTDLFASGIKAETQSKESFEDNTTETLVVCNECYAHFDSKADLIKHLKSHSLFICNLCSYRSLNIDTFTKHLYANHNSNHNIKNQKNVLADIHVCHFCHMKFSQVNELRRHLLYHTEEKRYSCPICGKIFGNKKLLNKHKVTHNKENIPCSKCNKNFSNKRNLTSHEREIHGPKNILSCTICPRKFNQRRYLRTHLKIHANPKAMVCPVCLIRFMNENNFKKHLLIHS